MLGKKCSCLRNMNGYQKPQQTSCRPMDEANCLYNSLPYKNKWISIELSKQMQNLKMFFVSPKSGEKCIFQTTTKKRYLECILQNATNVGKCIRVDTRSGRIFISSKYFEYWGGRGWTLLIILTTTKRTVQNRIIKHYSPFVRMAHHFWYKQTYLVTIQPSPIVFHC